MTPNEPKIFTVSEITREVRAVIETEIGDVWVGGEISNHRRQPSGHQYFTLKDEKSQLSCVLFFRPGMSLRQVPLADGMQVQARGRMTVYEARGQYQLVVSAVQSAGAGLLQARFEALKRRLDAEGLFAPERKRPLPKFPLTVGVVTSPTGAAIRDMVNILRRRAPWVRIILNPVRVQGEGASLEIAAAIGKFNEWERLRLPRPDVLIVGRGGGSAEDLWEFNEEVVARAIVASEIPVVSAVGHEIDFTIADFAADLRAPTPSAAAELVAPDAAEMARRLLQTESRMRSFAVAGIAARGARLEIMSRGVAYLDPRKRVADLAQSLDMLRETMERALGEGVSDAKGRVRDMLATLRQHRPDQIIMLRRGEMLAFADGLHAAFSRRMEVARERVGRCGSLLRILGPQATLERGYSITMTKGGEVVRSVGQVGPGMAIVTKLSDGSVSSEVKSD
jgi:exodeoxyribonuclease VII large subunit